MNRYDEIRQRFEEKQDVKQAEKMSAYMKNQFPFYGISAVDRKKICHDMLKEEKKNPKIEWELIHQCYQDEHREMQYFAIDYLGVKQNYLCYEDIFRIEPYLRSKEWWDSIDAFDTVIGDIGLHDDRVDSLMLEWSCDEDFWVRRIAIDHQLNRKEQTRKELLGSIILNNLGSKEFFINKAIGWSLREYSKTDPAWVTAFVEKHKDQMHSLSIKEASKYIGKAAEGRTI